jgi:O-6-methylguanine DNA methyltransferase
MNKTPVFSLAVPSSHGEFLAVYSGKGLCALRIPRRANGKAAVRHGGPCTNEIDAVPAQVKAWHRLTVKALDKALAGQPLGDLPPLDISSGTAFQQRVWQALRGIGRGRTASYGQVARAAGSPKAVRAVGGACGANPIPVFIPCHRVVATTGLGGFSAGLEWKRRLLNAEKLKAAN